MKYRSADLSLGSGADDALPGAAIRPSASSRTSDTWPWTPNGPLLVLIQQAFAKALGGHDGGPAALRLEKVSYPLERTTRRVGRPRQDHQHRARRQPIGDCLVLRFLWEQPGRDERQVAELGSVQHLRWGREPAGCADDPVELAGPGITRWTTGGARQAPATAFASACSLGWR